jgi:Zn-dependent protease with chaperone function
MVLAHELAHVKHRDPVAAMGRGFAIQMLYGFVTNDYSGSADMLSLSGEVGMSFFNRDQEKQADLKALTALNNHYGHVAGHADFFKSMLEEAKGEEDLGSMAEWLQTHPELQKRIDYLDEVVANDGLLLGERTPFPVLIRVEENP